MISGEPSWWNAAKQFLSNDPLIAPLIKKYDGESLLGKGDLFRTFVNAIVGQQISVIAADAIWNRLIEKVGAVKTATVAYFIPVFGVIWGYVFLGEPITLQILIGMMLILTGIIFTNKRYD